MTVMDLLDHIIEFNVDSYMGLFRQGSICFIIRKVYAQNKKLKFYVSILIKLFTYIYYKKANFRHSP